MRTRSQTYSQAAINSLSDSYGTITFLHHKRFKFPSDESQPVKKPRVHHNRFSFTLPKTKKAKIDKLISTNCFLNDTTTVGSGFKNMGNTCYINSVLQCLLYIPPLKNYYDLSEHSKKCNHKTECFICQYGQISQITQFTHYQMLSRNFAVIPENFLKCIPLINPGFSIGKQQDAHEFLMFFISKLEMSYTAYSTSNKFICDNLILKIFEGKIRSQVSCGKCKSISSTVDRFIDISLDVTESKSITDSLGNFCKVEELNGENKYYCEKCKRKLNSKKQLLFEYCKYIKLYLLYSSTNSHSSP